MSTEIDSLEIQVEAEARNANRALSSMEKHLDKIADSLMKVSALTNGVGEIGNFDFAGLKNFKTEMDSLFQTQKKMQKVSSPRINRSDLKYTAKSLDEIYNKFKKVGTGIDVSKMGLPELQAGLKKSEASLKRLNERLEKKVSVDGTKKLGKSYESLVYDIQKATNEAEIFRNEISKIKGKVPKFTITRGDVEKSYSPSYNGASKEISASSLNYNPEAMKMVYGEGTQYLKNFDDVIKAFGGNARTAAIALNEFNDSADLRKINTYEEQIRRLKSELSDIAFKGFSQGDENYDKKASELARVVAMQKKYNKEMKDAAEISVGYKKEKKRVDDVKKSLKNATKEASLFKKTISSINKFKKNLSDVKKALPFGKSERNNGMSWGRMIGSSVLFSFVFQGISAIQNAIKEGSNNLVQYSQTYNNSISSIVTSLSYLKNAWAAAFSPIMNVVAPYLSAFIDMVASALNSVGQFMAALTGKGFAVQAKKAWTDYGASLSDVGTGGSDAAKGLDDAKNSAEKLQKTILGFDQLNVLNDTNAYKNSGSGGTGGSGSGSSGSGGISPSDMFETVEISSSINKIADMIKEAWKNADFTEIGKIFGDKLNNALESINWSKIKKTSYKIGKSVATFLNGVMETPNLFRNIGITIGEGLNTAIYLAKGFVDNFNFEDFGNSISDSINGFFETVEWDTAAETISDGIIGALKSIESFLDETDFEEIADSIVEFISHTKFGDVVSKGISTIISGSVAQTDFFTGIGKSIAKRIVEGITGKELSGDLEKKFNTAIKPVEEIWKTLFSNLNPVTNAVRIFNLVKDTIQTKGDNIKKYFSDLWNSIKVLFSPVADFFREKFKSAYQNVQNVWKFASSWFQENVWIKIKNVFSSVKDYFKSAFKTAYNAVTDVWDDLSSCFKGIANSAIKPIGKLVNGIIDGVNWIGDKLGVGKVLKSWTVPKFANGTDGVSRDTIGVVNDQKGSTYRELVQFPNGKTIIPEGRNVMMTLPKGTKVMPAGQTKDLMKSYPHFAGGIGDFFSSAWTKVKNIAGTVWDYMQNPEKLLQIAINKFTDISGMVKPWSTIAGGIINKIFSGATNYVKKLFDKAMPSVNYTPSAGVEQWRQLAAKALQMTGQYTAANLNLLLYQMKTESGGNPNAINNWDINAKRGTPSKGLMQVIDPTFRAYAYPGYNKNIWDPLSNMLAAIRYTLSRYGSLANGWKGHGYALGGFPQTGEMFIANERGPELVGRMGNRNVVANNNQIVSGIKQGVIEAMMEVVMATGAFGNNSDNSEKILYVEVKTENDEVLARAVQRGNEKLDYRMNPSPAY